MNSSSCLWPSQVEAGSCKETGGEHCQGKFFDDFKVCNTLVNIIKTQFEIKWRCGVHGVTKKLFDCFANFSVKI